MAGEIHGLVGENGAGKSTMMKIIAGVHHDFEGEMRVDRRDVHLHSPRDALAAGIGMVHQELSIVPDLTVAENVFLGAQPVTAGGMVDWRAHEARGEAAARQPRPRHRSRQPAWAALPVGMQQLVELSRVLFSGARIIILDEPTSALSPPEVARLFEALRRLKAQGHSIIFISHFLDDVLAISDRITVFRNGRKVVTEATAPLDKDSVIAHMIGRGSAEMHMGESAELTGDDARPVVLDRERAQRRRDDPRHLADAARAARSPASTASWAAARSSWRARCSARCACCGGRLDARRQAGAASASTAAARRAGIAYLPESRRMMLFRTEQVYKNISIAILGRIHRMLLQPRRERAIADAHIKDLQIRPPRPDIVLGNLSGGNQQKVALAKWLTHLPKVLILSEPTRGMDVGAKEDVIRIVKALRDRGVAMLVLSTEPETILTLADRVTVMKRGVVAREFASGHIEKADLLGSGMRRTGRR